MFLGDGGVLRNVPLPTLPARVGKSLFQSLAMPNTSGFDPFVIGA